MKKIITLLFAGIFSLPLFAQKSGTYAIKVNFSSFAAGVPDSKPLFDKITAFKKQYRIKKKISYDHIGPLGREGEYMIGFTLTELTKKQKACFIKEIKEVVPTLKDRGSASFEENVPVYKEEPNSRVKVTKNVT